MRSIRRRARRKSFPWGASRMGSPSGRNRGATRWDTPATCDDAGGAADLHQARVRAAHRLKRLGVAVEARARVSAEEREALALDEGIPKPLELQRGGRIALAPEQRHHFAEGTHLPMPCPRARKQWLHRRLETRLIRPAIDHEAVEDFLGEQRDVALLPARAVDLEPGVVPQALLEIVEVSRAGDHDDAFAREDSTRDEALERVEEHVVVVIDLHRVLVRRDRAPR